MVHPYQHPDASFSYSQRDVHPQQGVPFLSPPAPHYSTSIGHTPMALPLATTTSKPRKAKRQRKKITPPGPAGIWFLSHSTSKKKKRKSSTHIAQREYGDSPSSSQEDALSMSVHSNAGHNHNHTHNSSKHHHHRKGPSSFSTVASNPAWTAMQCTLNWYTPEVPLSVASAPIQRYQRLRPHTPTEYCLLPEILSSSQFATAWKLPPARTLIVLVLSVACHHDDIWTVELQDDTGASIQAWMQPSFVQAEKQQHADDNATGPRYIRPGYVWCLTNVTIMLQQSMGGNTALTSYANTTTCTTTTSSNGAGNSKMPQRMLLISERNVSRVWMPDSLEEVEDSVYCEWVEKRSAIQSQVDEAEATSANNSLVGNSHDDEHAQNPRNPNNNDDDHNSSSDEEEDDEDRYRRQQYQQTAKSRADQHQDTMQNDMIGGPILRSLHTPGRTISSSRLPVPQQKTARQQPAITTCSQHITANTSDEGAPRSTGVLRSHMSPFVTTQQPSLDGQILPQNVVFNTVTPGQFSAAMKSSQSLSQRPNSQHAFSNNNYGANSSRAISAIAAEKAPLSKNNSNSNNNIMDESNRRVSFSQLSNPQVAQQSQFMQTAHQSAPAAIRNLNKENQLAKHGNTESGNGSRVDQVSKAIPSRMLKPTTKTALDLSQSSASPATNPEPISASCSKATEPENHALPLQKLTTAETTPPARNRTKGKSKRNKRTGKYDASPLSQSPKPAMAKLWTSAAVMDGAGLLNFSSDDEDDGAVPMNVIASQNKKPLEAATASLSNLSKPKPPAPSVLAAAGKFGVGAPSLFQATSLPGINWMGLSDDEDD